MSKLVKERRYKNLTLIYQTHLLTLTFLKEIDYE